METEQPSQKSKLKKSVPIVLVFLIVGAIGLGLFLKPVFSNNSGNQSQTNTTTNPAAPIKLDLYQAKVTIGSRSVIPTTVKVKKGDSVAWINQDRSMHLIVSDTGFAGFKGQGALLFSDTYLFTFTTSGTYTYHDQFNPSLKGTVIVE